jgi:hypothetical protein
MSLRDLHFVVLSVDYVAFEKVKIDGEASMVKSEPPLCLPLWSIPQRTKATKSSESVPTELHSVALLVEQQTTEEAQRIPISFFWRLPGHRSAANSTHPTDVMSSLT